MVLQVRGRRLDSVPDSLEGFFDENPEVGMANLLLTEMDHTSMWREEVLFIKQRQQATSDYRENKKVRWIGSHAALTCHIAVMRHVETGVSSIGHFDNFCCWQFGEESSAHKDGIRIMLDEIRYLSPPSEGDEEEDWCGVEVTVVGGYEDERGDAAKNSLSLLRALHEEERIVELRHFCVGPYNTRDTQDGERSTAGGPLGPKTAILKGIALDLKSQMLFPAIFDWAQFSDFDLQIKDKLRVRLGGVALDTEEHHKTQGSTFKPKSLRNKAKEKHDQLQKEERLRQEEEERKKRRRMTLEEELDASVRCSGVFRVNLRPTAINDKRWLGHRQGNKGLGGGKANSNGSNSSKIMHFRKREEAARSNEL